MKEHKALTKRNKRQNIDAKGSPEEYINDARGLLNAAGENDSDQADAIIEIVKNLMGFGNVLMFKRSCEQLSKEFNIRKGDFDDASKQILKEQKLQSKMDQDESALITRTEAFIADGFEILYNEVSNRFVCKEHGNDSFGDLNIDNIYRQLRKAHINCPMGDLKSLLRSDFIKKYNPFEDYFTSLPEWDGVDYINSVTGYLTVHQISDKLNEKDRFGRMFRKMLVRSIACCLGKDFNKHCLTFVHDKQSSGKTTFLRWLCPPLLEDYYTENIGLTKDDMIALTENFIVNIDELSVLSKYDINQLKSLLSKDKIKVRLPYGERAENLQRRCNFVASTNNLEFLHDETGSVRWICFLLEDINWAYKKEVDINKVWAQAYHLYRNGFNYQLTSEEIQENEDANKFFFIRTPEMETIQKYFMPGNKDSFERNPELVKFMTATDIIAYVETKFTLSIRFYKNNVGKALKMLGFTQISKYDRDRGMSIKGYYVIPVENDGNVKFQSMNEVPTLKEPANLPF